MQFILSLLFLIILISCSSVSDFKTSKSEKDYYVLENKRTNYKFGAIRDKDKNLIREKEQAEKRLSQFKEMDDIKANEIAHCDGGYEQSKKLHKIDTLLEKKKSKKARALLKELKKECENIEFNSNYFYALAYSYEIDGNIEERDKNLKKFLKKSEQTFPNFAHQTNSKAESDKVYKAYIKNAKAALKGEAFKYKMTKEKHLEIARYKDRTNSFLPGYKNEQGRFFLILPSYSSATGGGISALYNFSTKYGEFIPAYTYNELTDGLGSLIFRRQISQSIDRRHSTGINIAVYQWKDIRYSRNYYTGEASDYEVLDEGVGASFGYGGTYQLSDDFLYIYQGRIYSSKNSGTRGTSLLAYSLSSMSSTESIFLEAGLFNDVSIIGLRWGFIQIFRNYSANSTNFQLSFGF